MRSTFVVFVAWMVAWMVVACGGDPVVVDGGSPPHDAASPPSDGSADVQDSSVPDAAVRDAAARDSAVRDSAVRDSAIAIDAGVDAGPPPPECARSSDPLAAPASMTPHVLSWEEAVCGAAFPDVGGYPCPIGSFTIRNLSVREHGIAIEFAAPETLASLRWVEAQPVSFHGYRTGRPADAVFVGISECPLDRRAAVASSPPARPEDEDLLRGACRKYAQSSTIFFGPEPGLNVCGLVPGRTYYLNVLFVDEDLQPTCTTGELCEANFQ